MKLLDIIEKRLYIVFALTIFLSSFLLFFVQPLLAKYILPWFGGGLMVWAVALVFYQVLLLGGYTYAHLLSKLPPKKQFIIHLLLLIGSLAILPIIPDASLKPDPFGNPTLQILTLLGLTIGLPYLLLSSSSPLLQSWFASTASKKSPYPLFAISNAASLLALLSYPFLFEPMLTLNMQAILWSIAFALTAGALLICLLYYFKRGIEPETLQAETEEKPDKKTKALWIIYPAIASLFLLATTNQLSIDLAPVPFLWILPLSIYLFSFILTFHDEFWYPRKLFFPAFIVILIVVLGILFNQRLYSTVQIITVYNVALFIGCMIAHGEVARIKPHKQYLTSFYLYLATGGALGGFFVGIIAPLIFPAYFEFHLALVLTSLIVLFISLSSKNSLVSLKKSKILALLMVNIVVVLFWGIASDIKSFIKDPIYISRNFYGVLRVTNHNSDDAETAYRSLYHGSTLHGMEFTLEEKQNIPTSYYGKNSGAELAVSQLRDKESLKIGVLGLGSGTLASLAGENDEVRFYEIDPEVVRVAEKYFYFLDHFKGKKEIVPGDARLSMEKEAPQGFDILFMDAFSSDSVPAHLLTKEAFDIYLKHVKDTGIIAVHVSNRFLDLEPVIFRLAEHFNLNPYLIITDSQTYYNASSSWILLSRQELTFPEKGENYLVVTDFAPSEILWTDDFYNLLSLMKN